MLGTMFLDELPDGIEMFGKMRRHRFEARSLHNNERVIMGAHHNEFFAFPDLERGARFRRDDDLAFLADRRNAEELSVA
jgi:hypothetical protein